VGNFVSYEMLHKQGTHRIDGTASTFGLTSGLNVGIASTSLSGTQQSQLAAQVKPPVFYGESVGCVGLALFLAAVVGGFFFLGVNGWLAAFVAIALGGAGWFANERHEMEQAVRKQEHAANYAEWERKYMCMACGATRSLP
jgi:hypothetical protein